MIIGAGFMGAGIAQVCIQSGYRVILTDTKKEMLEKAKADMAGSLEKLHRKGKIKEPAEPVLDRLEIAQSIEAGSKSKRKIS